MTTGLVETAPPKAPLFSIIVNSYNGAAYLRATLDSVVAQTCTDFECIVWDDASTDVTSTIARSYTDPRFRRFASPRNLRIGSARNRAIAEARGEWLAFLDQDDLWTPDKLALQAALIAAGGPRLGLVYGRAIRFSDRRTIGEFDPWHAIGHQPTGDIFAKLMLRPSFVALSAVVLRRSAVAEIGGVATDIDYCPDFHLVLNVARGWTAACTPALVCLYRVHRGGMSQVFTREIHQEIFRIIATAARPGDDGIVRRRATVTQTLLALHEIVSGQWVLGGWHLLSRGSVAYAVGRQFVRRAWRPAMHNWVKR